MNVFVILMAPSLIFLRLFLFGTAKIFFTQSCPTKSVESVYDGVHNGPILGTGAAGIVRKCTHRQTGVDFAVKCLNIGLIESDEIIESLREEIFIMCQADHPDIIRLEEVYESDSQIYLILKLMQGGDMFDRLDEQPDYHYSEVQCAQIVRQMTSAVRYLHMNNVIHRDLKLGTFKSTVVKMSFACNVLRKTLSCSNIAANLHKKKTILITWYTPYNCRKFSL